MAHDSMESLQCSLLSFRQAVVLLDDFRIVCLFLTGILSIFHVNILVIRICLVNRICELGGTMVGDCLRQSKSETTRVVLGELVNDPKPGAEP